MTTLTNLELTCPVCSERFHTQAVVSTNSFGGKRTDFHERAAGTQPLPYFVHVCKKCGFAGNEFLFEPANREALTPELIDQLRDSLQTFATRETSGSAKYEAAATTATILGEDMRVIADFYLRAAWCCVDEGDTEAERYFRLKSARAFMDVLGSYDGVVPEERGVLTYLVGELWRRIGNIAAARMWFDRVEAAVIDRKTQQWIIDAARQQRDCPREWFGTT